LKVKRQHFGKVILFDVAAAVAAAVIVVVVRLKTVSAVIVTPANLEVLRQSSASDDYYLGTLGR
jgi:hypothetical protein